MSEPNPHIHHPPPPASSSGPGGDSLADVLDRVLDKGLVIAGDISISLVDVEVVTIKVRLLLASADKAREMGIDWWRHDPHLSQGARKPVQKEKEPAAAQLEEENRLLREQLQRLENRVSILSHELPGENSPSAHER